MKKKVNYAVIIPALNEEASIANVLTSIPDKFKELIVVADNGSTDGTAQIAQTLKAQVVTAREKGYGSACQSGIAFAKQFDPEVYIFLDADFSDNPQEMTEIVSALEERKLDLVIGSRKLGEAEPGALLPQAVFGNWLATWLMWLLFGYRFTDLGPFRAIRSGALSQLNMKDKNFGWTVEMQIKALKLKLRVGEVAVSYKKRIGVSKITGTLRGTVMAGYKILWTIFRYGILN